MKKLITAIASVTLAFVLLISSIFLMEEKAMFSSSKGLQNRKTVIIDAGHGGYDGGAVASDGTSEKDINLIIAQNLKEFLLCFGFDVKMTRNADISTNTNNEGKFNKINDLNSRIKIMEENPDAVFVSIHLNKFTTSSAVGSQVFYSAKTDSSEALAQNIQLAIQGFLQPDNDRIIKKSTDSIYILKKARVPAVIVECGFLSNKTELEKLKEENYQRMMAFSIFCGIMNYHNENAGK